MNKFEQRKKTIYEFMGDEFYVPMKKKEIAGVLGITKEQRPVLDEILDELVTEGKVTLTSNGRYMKSVESTFTGKFVANAAGFGFIEIEGEKEDFFVGADNTRGAMHGDTVKACLLPKRNGKRREAKVLEVVDRAVEEVVGTFENCKTFGFVICDNKRFDKDVFVPIEKSMGAMDGHKVVCRLTSYGTKNSKPEGEIIEILGHINDPGVDVLSIVKAFDIPAEFPQKVMDQTAAIPQTVDPSEYEGRKDLRDWLMVTIDGEDTKDIDDAVSLILDNGNYILGVHIADVSNYVHESSALDVEAYNRGTSVYLADRVIPMLPHALSNGICSLNEDVDRLALSCIMTINKDGQIIEHEIYESVIHSNKKMTYTIVNGIINGDEGLKEAYSEYADMFLKMDELAKLLRGNRQKRGALDFDVPETKLEIDENGACVGLHPYDRNAATRLIEDFMLAANETVAEHFFWLNAPFLYRVHGNPDGEKIKSLKTLLGAFGYTLHGDPAEIYPKELQKLLTAMEGKEEEQFLSSIMLRAMQQAKYSPECEGHFGLAAKYYCHFTSPIRRYPDLLIHRIIKEYLHGNLEGRVAKHYSSQMDVAANDTSKKERRAEECEREVTKLKKAQYMLGFVGEEYEAVISSVTGWGMYVQLPNTVEGLIHVSTLRDDHYVFNEPTYELIGQHKNRHFTIGQKVRVRLAYVDMATRNLDFELL